MIQETVLGVKRHNDDYRCCITVFLEAPCFSPVSRRPTQVYPDMPSIGRKACPERAPADKDANSEWLSV